MNRILLFSICICWFHFLASGVSCQKNVLGGGLQICSKSPLTGFTRTGKCETNAQDQGTHLACSTVSSEFLEYTKSKGNDLSSPRGSFPGLKPGDNWCLCVFRWMQAYQDGYAPPLVLNATHSKVLDYLSKNNYGISLDDLKKYAV